MTTLAGFEHRFVPPPDGSRGAHALLLLHGTGGDETDLLPLGPMLDPSAALLSPRGKVLENGMPRFFRRLREGVFDEEDLRRRAAELAGFVREARQVHELGPVTAAGFSNGANIAAALMLLDPEVIDRAVLLSPMVPLTPESRPDLSGVPVLIASGQADAIAPPDQARRLAALLEAAGADVSLEWHGGGHGVTRETIAAARRWLAGHPPRRA